MRGHTVEMVYVDQTGQEKNEYIHVDTDDLVFKTVDSIRELDNAEKIFLEVSKGFDDEQLSIIFVPREYQLVKTTILPVPTVNKNVAKSKSLAKDLNKNKMDRVAENNGKTLWNRSKY